MNKLDRDAYLNYINDNFGGNKLNYNIINANIYYYLT